MPPRQQPTMMDVAQRAGVSPMTVSRALKDGTSVSAKTREKVARAARDIAGVVAADNVAGPYDVIVKTEAETLDELGQLVVSAIQKAQFSAIRRSRASYRTVAGRWPNRIRAAILSRFANRVRSVRPRSRRVSGRATLKTTCSM